MNKSIEEAAEKWAISRKDFDYPKEAIFKFGAESDAARDYWYSQFLQEQNSAGVSKQELGQRYNQWLINNSRNDGNYSNTVFDFIYETKSPLPKQIDDGK